MDFDWKCYPEIEEKIFSFIEECLRANNDLLDFKNELYEKTSARLCDIIDHIILGRDQDISVFVEHGFTKELSAQSYDLYCHLGAQFPRLKVECGSPHEILGIAIIVESISDFLGVRGIYRDIEGAIFAPFRRALISKKNGVSFWVIERRGTRVLDPVDPPLEYQKKYLEAVEKCKIRDRQDSLDESKEPLCNVLSLANGLVALFGTDLAAYIFLQSERFYWQNRNLAARLQMMRQESCGIGWANHDHHTFRSSRENFCALVQLFKILGFHCRERFYAGKEAGWGAQVMENPRANYVVFLDVDLADDEIEIDFSQTVLKPLLKLGTVGLWCKLHGDSIMEGGMHHLEAQFSFESIRKALLNMGVEPMEPFSKFSYLHQAFTKGEMWPVAKERLGKLFEQRLISGEQKEKFEKFGALGSHLEHLERREGYKGFNKNNVSRIIQETDPRYSAT